MLNHGFRFKYRVQDAQGNYTQANNSTTGQTEAMKATVYLQTSDIPNGPLAVEQWYLGDTSKNYQNSSCSRSYSLGCWHKRPVKHTQIGSKTMLHLGKCSCKNIKVVDLGDKYASRPMNRCARSYEIYSKKAAALDN